MLVELMPDFCRLGDKIMKGSDIGARRASILFCAGNRAALRIATACTLWHKAFRNGL